MAQWNLSVDLRGQGASLARTLRQNATHARTLAAATRAATGEVRTLSRTTSSAAGTVRSLGTAASAARRDVGRLGSTARSTTGDITRVGGAADMARARLIRMAGQARDAARDMRDLAAAAALAEAQLRAAGSDVRITARLEDRTGPGTAAVRAAVNDLQRLSPVRLSVAFDGDPAQITATATAMRDLHSDSERAGTALATLTGHAAAAAAALRQVTDAAQDTSRALRTLRGRAAATADALDDLRNRALLAATGLRSLNTAARSADGHLNTLSGRTRTLRSDMDDLDGALTRVHGRMGGLRGTVSGLGSSTSSASSGTRNLAAGVIALATALIPVAASIAPLAAGLTAAGAGAVAFGVAVAGQINALSEATDAQDAYDKAVREHGKASPEAAKAEKELVRQMQEMPPATRRAAAGLSVLKDEYTGWSNALAGDTMPLANKSFSILAALFPKMTPLVKGTSRELDRFLNIVAGGMNTDSFDRFMASFAEFSEESLAKANSGLVRFTQSLDTGEIGGSVAEFMRYAKENGPLVGDTLTALSQALVHLLVAASDVGVGMLQAVNVFAKLVDAVPTSLISALLQVAVAVKAVNLAMAGFAIVGPVMATAATNTTRFIRSARFGGVATAISSVTASLTAMQKASIVLAALALVAMGISKLADKAKGAPPDIDKLATSLKNLESAGKFGGELKKTFGDMDGFVEKASRMRGETEALGKAQDLLKFTGVGDGVAKVTQKLDELTRGTKSLSATKEDFKAFDESFASLVSGGHADLAAEQFRRFADALRAAGWSTKDINKMFPEYQAAVTSLKAENELAARSMGVFGEQAQATKAKLDAQKASADGLRQAIVALNEANRASLGGMIAFEQAIDDAAKAAQENAGSLRMSHGELDLNSEKSRNAATALQDLATKTDEAATSARESGQSWESVNGIYERGRQKLVDTAVQMGLTRGQAQALTEELLQVPEKKTTTIEMRREDAIAGLDAVIAKIKATPGAKSVTVKALTADAISLLNSLGYKTKTLPDGRVVVTAKTGSALAGIGAVQAARDRLSDRSITITTTYVKRTVYDTDANGVPDMVQAPRKNARGSILDFYAAGGTNRAGRRENHVAQIAPAGAWRVWAEPETDGEGYVPFARSKRTRSRAITEEIVRRLGGDPDGIQWNAAGSVTDWRYDPTTGSLYSPSDAGAAGNKTKKVKGKDVSYFDLAAVEKKLKSTSAATRAWNRDLEKVADRVGGDVADALAAMGKDGVALTKKMANGSTKYINDMAAALRNLATTAKASLSDYTRQVTKATATDNAFAANLAKLAGQGYGELAKQLAAQNDTAAQQLAAAAVKDKKKAASANSAASKANNALTNDQVQDLVAIIAAVKTSKTGIHDVAGTTGLGEDVIIAVASKATAQIKSALGSRATKFLADLARGQKGMSYADGGIRAGMYATQGGIIRFAEPETHGEALIPLGRNKRGPATRVLADVASRFGVGLTDASTGRPVVIIRQSGDTHVTLNPVRTEASATDIAAQVGRSVRRANRGGVAARARA
ncbi:hypothetical protein [Streptomyces hebeiensis]